MHQIEVKMGSGEYQPTAQPGDTSIPLGRNLELKEET
jgi:hypothetical protein